MAGLRRAASTLSLCLFANQAGTLVLSPTLLEVASDFAISPATAGQLRSISGGVAAVTAICAGYLAARLGLRRLLLCGLATMAAASALSAAAPSFAVLAFAQALLGVAVGILLSAGIAGVTAWIPIERRADALSAAFSGQAIAWLVGMPIVGAAAGVSWRLAWVVLPLAATVPAFFLAAGLREVRTPPVRLRGELRAVVSDRVVLMWWLAEVLSFSAWVGMLVYSGALLIDSYGVSLEVAGLLLGVMFVAYLPGSLLFRRHVGTHAGQLLIALPLAGAGVAATIGLVRPGLWMTMPLLALYVFVNSGRTIAGSAYGLDAAPGRSVSAMGMRASAAQLGYLLGAGVGGLALHLGGYEVLGAVFAGLYLLAVVPHALLHARPTLFRTVSSP
jgi:predicted MFS family arabinose efflux permease